MSNRREREISRADERLMDVQARSRLLAEHDRRERRLLAYLDFAADREAEFDARIDRLIRELATHPSPARVAEIARELRAAHAGEAHWDGEQRAIGRELMRINQVEDTHHQADAADKAALARAFGHLNGAHEDLQRAAPARQRQGQREERRNDDYTEYSRRAG